MCGHSLTGASEAFNLVDFTNVVKRNGKSSLFVSHVAKMTGR